MRFHLPALPGQPITKENSTCAFTQKVRKFANMMVPRGHEVFIYGDPENDSLATEHVPCYPACDPPAFTPEAWEEFNLMALPEIVERAEPDDFLGLMGGRAQQLLDEVVPQITCEYGIGYGGSFAKFRVFESYAWMHTTYGEQRGTNTADGSFYDAVIPAYFEVEDFPPPTDSVKPYLLYIGRLEERKGIQVACETAERLGETLYLAGEGPYQPSYGEALGKVGPEERGPLMANAKAVLVPTIYVEPFGFVAVEAQLCGTPAITTDWGAFTETVEQGVAGFRCRTLGEFMDAVGKADDLDRDAIRERAIANYSLEAIAPQYERYFERLTTLRNEGWYNTDWSGLVTV